MRRCTTGLPRSQVRLVEILVTHPHALGVVVEQEVALVLVLAQLQLLLCGLLVQGQHQVQPLC